MIPIVALPSWNDAAQFVDDYFDQLKIVSYPEIDDYDEISDAECAFMDAKGSLYAIFKERTYSLYPDIDEDFDDLREWYGDYDPHERREFYERHKKLEQRLFKDTAQLVEEYFPTKIIRITKADSDNIWYTGALRALK